MHDSVSDCADHGFSATANLELGKDGAKIMFYRVFRDIQFGTDSFVAASFGQQVQYLHFAGTDVSISTALLKQGCHTFW